MKVIFIILLGVFIFGACFPLQDSAIAQVQSRRKSQKKSIKRYACPMHPEVTSTRPGKCPKCEMALRLVKPEDANASAAPSNNVTEPATEQTNAIAALRIPDTPVYDQNGNRLNFYTDLVKGKTVAINFIFTTCTTICPPLTATFRRVQTELGEHAGRDVRLISISVDPVTDVPERLRAFAAKFKAGPGWTFVTGDKSEIDQLLKALGAAVADKNDHTPMILIGNEPAGFWTRTYGLSPPSTLARILAEAANR
ncbi:MAG TPA: SCO family protein [Pyrinomonadaceae bacterium]|jgi:cytochrome oxidase Cu insertion factor (SCO1/SenC/PrrC family)